MNHIKLAVVDDEHLFREGIKLMISGFEGIDVILEATNGQEFLAGLADAPVKPDIVLLDLKMPVLNGVETAKILGKDYPKIRIIVLSSYFSESFVFNMVELGAAAYLPKNTLLPEVENTIRSVASNGFYYNDQVLQIIREGMKSNEKHAKVSFIPKVTRREKEVLELICKQHTNSEIAQKLFISDRTVDGHRMNLLQKLGCRNTAGLVAFALQHQLVRVDPSQFWQ